MELKAEFITREGHIYSIMTEKLNLPGIDGRRTILTNHVPIMLPIKMGVIETLHNGVLSHYAVDGGVVYFRNNTADILIGAVKDVGTLNKNSVTRLQQDAARKSAQSENDYQRQRNDRDLKWTETLVKAVERYGNK